jgi:hypothetical protein
MRKLLGVGLVLFGCVVLVWFGLRYERGRELSDPTPHGPSADPALAAEVEDLAVRIRALEEAPPADRSEDDRLAQLEARVDALAERIEQVAAATTRATPEEDLAVVETEDLAVRARAATGRRDYAAAAEYWRAYLERDLTQEERGTAQLSLGMAYRMLGDREKELRAFQDSLATCGEESEEGLTALFHVGWTNASIGKEAVGRDLMLRVAADDRANPYIRKWARYYSADYSDRMGDVARAREILTGIIRDYADARDASGAQLLDYARRKLEAIENR